MTEIEIKTICPYCELVDGRTNVILPELDEAITYQCKQGNNGQASNIFLKRFQELRSDSIKNTDDCLGIFCPGCHLQGKGQYHSVLKLNNQSH